MGKTTPTYRDALTTWIDQWSQYRRGLRAERQEAFDRVTEHAEQLAMAGGLQNEPSIETTILVSICVEQQREIEELQEAIGERE